MGYILRMKIQGQFELQMTGEPPYAEVEGVTLARAAFTKQFTGALVATSTVHMIGARTPVEGSAGYVAIEQITGSLDGRAGTFVVQHFGVMTRGEMRLEVLVVPDSGTGELRGLRGQMQLDKVDGKHRYTLDYELA